MDTDKAFVKKLAAVLAVLIVLYGASFLIRKNDSKSMTVNTTLLNTKYVPSVTEIRISIPETVNKGTDFTGTVNGRKEIVLKKYGSIWTGEEQTGTDKVIWPADKSTVENMIDSFAKVRKLYEKSASVKNFDSLSVTDEKAAAVEFVTQNGQTVSKLLFGNENTLTSRINVRSSAKLNVYEIDSDISLYLNARSSFFADPYLYPLCITSFTAEETASLLRHGNISDSLSERNECTEQTPVDSVRKDFSDGSGVRLRIYSADSQKENTYTVVPQLIPSLTAGKDEINGLSRINYTYSISSWTYEKLKQLQ